MHTSRATTLLAEAEMHLVDQSDPEWERMWNRFPDPVMYNPDYGESLQYMGTFPNPEYGGRPGEARYYHDFRHRSVPRTHERRIWKIPASLGWRPRP